MIDFLHDKGYNYFNINKLTFPEIKRLIDYKNKKVREQNRQQRIANANKKRGKK